MAMAAMADDGIKRQSRPPHHIVPMVDADEIAASAARVSLDPGLIEQDYISGWLLAAVSTHPDLRQAWIFRGGSCARKCYGAGSRFVGELQFAVPAEAALQADLLLPALHEAAVWVQRRAGIELQLPPFNSFRDEQLGLCCELPVAYRGPLTSSGVLPHIHLHLTAGESEVFAPATRYIDHPYSDGPPGGLIRCCASEELIAESFLRLARYAEPGDLYDLVTLVRHAGRRLDTVTVFNAVRRKCTQRKIAVPNLSRLGPKLKAMSGQWWELLPHQVSRVPSFDQFCAEVVEFFGVLEQVAPPHRGINLRVDAIDEDTDGRQLFFYECPLCGKRARRFQRDAHLHAHKAPDGTSCPGRRGYFVETASTEPPRSASQPGQYRGRRRRLGGSADSFQHSRMRIGYARVSTLDQTLALQRDALKEAGCDKIFADHGVSGTATARPGLARAMKALKPGDTLVVWKLDRLGRSLSHLVQIVSQLGARGVNFRSLSDPIDTESAGGRLVLHMMGALAEFERSLIIERTRAGLAAAKKRGQKLGRKPTLTPPQIAEARRLIEGGEKLRAVAASFSVGRTTLWRALKAEAPPARPTLTGYAEAYDRAADAPRDQRLDD